MNIRIVLLVVSLAAPLFVLVQSVGVVLAASTPNFPKLAFDVGTYTGIAIVNSSSQDAVT
jgi:hypothetical protein